MEIRFEDPKQVPSMIKLLAVALQTNGFDFRAVRHPGIPTTEIWLSIPLDDGKKTLLSCAATIGEQVAERVALRQALRVTRHNNRASQSQGVVDESCR